MKSDMTIALIAESTPIFLVEIDVGIATANGIARNLAGRNIMPSRHVNIGRKSQISIAR